MAARVAAAEAALQTAQSALRNATTFSEIQIQTHHLHIAHTELLRAKQAVRDSSGNGFSATLGVAAIDSAFSEQANPQIAAQSVATAAQTALFGMSPTPYSLPFGGYSSTSSSTPSLAASTHSSSSRTSTMRISQHSETAQAAVKVKYWLKAVNRNHNFFTRDVRKLITTAPTSHLLPAELLLELKKVVANLETIERIKQIQASDESLSIEEDRAYMQARRNCSESGTRCLQIIEKNRL